MTLAELAEKSGYSVATINGLELHGAGSRRLKAKLHDILRAQEITVSVKPAVDRFVDAPDSMSLEQWKLRATHLEEKLEQLRANLRAALSLSEAGPVSSKPVSAAAHYGARASASAKTDPAE